MSCPVVSGIFNREFNGVLMRCLKFISSSEKQTHLLAKRLAKGLKKNDCLALVGDFGTGKTTFVRGLVEGLEGRKKNFVCSPSFVILKIYQGRLPVYHFDLYRLNTERDLEDIGFSEFITSGGISAIEWADRVKDVLPKASLRIEFSSLDENKRSISFYPSLKRLEGLVRGVFDAWARVQ